MDRCSCGGPEACSCNPCMCNQGGRAGTGMFPPSLGAACLLGWLFWALHTIYPTCSRRHGQTPISRAFQHGILILISFFIGNDYQESRNGPRRPDRYKYQHAAAGVRRDCRRGGCRPGRRGGHYRPGGGRGCPFAEQCEGKCVLRACGGVAMRQKDRPFVSIAKFMVS